MSAYLPALHRVRIETYTPDSNHTVSAGDDLTLTCNASFFTSRQWIKAQGMNLHSEVVSDTQDGRIFINPSFQLEFRGIIVEDEDIYRCSLRNELGAEVITHRVIVIGG